MSQNFLAEDDPYPNLRKEAMKIMCPDCKGMGRIVNTKSFGLSVTPKKMRRALRDAETCRKCKGYGRLDWIEMATGKK